MKKTTLKCVLEEDLRNHVKSEINERGDQVKLAVAIGTSQSNLSAYVKGQTKDGRQIPAHYGLEPVTVYVRKNDNQNKA